MEALLDEELVMVLQHLDVPDLLACRLVSKRVGALVLHPGVWARRVFNPYDGEGQRAGAVGVLPQCVCPVLRLSPCLGALHVVLPPPRWCPSALYSSTDCAAARLRLVVNGSIVASKAAEFIRRQEALGRLRFIDLTMHRGRGTEAGFNALLGTAVSVLGLEGLSLNLPFKPDPPVECSTLAACLRRFRCSLTARTEAFVNAVLAAHAATLERVDLLGRGYLLRLNDNGWRFDPKETLPLLAGAPNLSDLTSDCLSGLAAVARESLTVLNLSINYERHGYPTPSALEEAADLLRRAEHLQNVALEYTFPPGSETLDHFDGVDLVLSLAASGRSRVETLTIWNYNYAQGVEVVRDNIPDHLNPLRVVQVQAIGQEPAPVQVVPVLRIEPSPDPKPFPQLQPLISALPSLTHLRHLRVDVVTTELLLALSPATAPALRRVELSLGVECIHEWLHEGDMVKGVMSANPSLHLELQANYCNMKYCKVCLQGCHKELWDERPARSLGVAPGRLGLFAHDPTERCSVDHTADRQWLRVPLVDVEVPCDANGLLFEVLDTVISSALLASSNSRQ